MAWTERHAAQDMRGTGMPDANAMEAIPSGVGAATPAIPAIAAAPAVASNPLVAAPIPPRTVPAVVVPAVFIAIGGEVLDPLDRLRALASRLQGLRKKAYGRRVRVRRQDEENEQHHPDGGA